jgi:hypothetical protein
MGWEPPTEETEWMIGALRNEGDLGLLSLAVKRSRATVKTNLAHRGTDRYPLTEVVSLWPRQEVEEVLLTLERREVLAGLSEFFGSLRPTTYTLYPSTLPPGILVELARLVSNMLSFRANYWHHGIPHDTDPNHMVTCHPIPDSFKVDYWELKYRSKVADVRVVYACRSPLGSYELEVKAVCYRVATGSRGLACDHLEATIRQQPS